MRPRHLVLLLAPLACAAPPALAPLAPLEVPPLVDHGLPLAPIDVEHLALEIRLDPGQRSIDASARLDFTARRDLERVELDLLGDLEVRWVTDPQGRGLAFEHAADRLVIALAEPLASGARGAVEVAYHGRPREGLWFSGADDAGRPTQVFTHGQCEASRGWFPCFDHPSDRITSEITATVPGTWTTLAAGRRLESRTEGDWRTEHWTMEWDHPCYLVTLVAGEFAVARDRWLDAELIYAVEPHLEDFLEPTFDVTPRVLEFLSEAIGLPYPYSKYSQACVDNFPWGGMENISATTLTPLILTDERGRRDRDGVDLIVHEAAHQWFGDLITCNDWSHIWLNEGFASYFECLWLEATEGVDAFRASVRAFQDVHLAHATGVELQATVSARYREAVDLFDADVYAGAAVRLHLLRFVIGDEAFWTAMEDYAKGFAGSNAVTEDFQRVCERVSGQRLASFFEQWFYRPGFPSFDLSWTWDDEGFVELEVRQTQTRLGGTPEVFRTPVEVEVRVGGEVTRHRLEIDERRERFSLPASDEPDYVHFDVGGWIPKTVTWSRSAARWMALAESCEDVTARHDAAQALGRLARQAAHGAPEAHETLVAALVQRLRHDPSPWVRAAAASALGQAWGPEARARLIAAAREDADAAVRARALEALTGWGEDRELAALAEEAYAGGYSYAVQGSAAWLRVNAGPADGYDWLVQRLGDPSPHDNLRERLISVLGVLDDGRVDDELLRWAADPDTSPGARGAAVRRLAERGRDPVVTARRLGEWLEVEAVRLRQAVVRGLATLDNPASRRLLREYYPRAGDASERRVIEAALELGR